MNFKLHTLAIAVATTALLTACNDSNDNRTELQKAQGVWKRTSYGQVIKINSTHVTHYQLNNQGCIEVNKQTHQQAKNGDFARVSQEKSTLLVMNDVNVSTYTSTDKLPETCNAPITVKEDAKPSQVFEYFWHAFNDYYAFFDIRHVDWQAQYDTYAPRINDAMSDEELFAVMADMVAPLQDAHVYLESKTQEFNVLKPSPIMRSAEGEAKSYLRFGFDVETMDVVASMLEDYEETTASYITESTLKTVPLEEGPKTLIWGKTADNVGILVINNLADFSSDPEASVRVHMEAALKYVDEIMSDLKDTDGMIIDIRNNLGGEDAIAKLFAKQFNQKEGIAFHKRANNRAGLGSQSHHILNAVSDPYLKPVYLLTSQITMSAGEVFAMMMKQLPQVTHIGEETSGAFSDVLRLTLPNGWEVGLSNEEYRNLKGENFEARGLQPDVQIPAFSGFSDELLRFATYDYALEKLGKQTYPAISVASFEAQVNELMAQSELPGLAVAVIQNGQLTYSQGFGVADIQGTQVQADTPFYLASVSKTLVGATLAHAVDAGQISIDDSIASIVPFTFDAIPEKDQPITFRHLVTHTSGIVDETIAYTCSYFLHDTMQNMNDALLGSEICDEKINPDLGTYLANYLSENGTRYQEKNFTSQYGHDTGDIYVYSNIATALAAFALQEKTETPFVELVQNYLFSPLAMNNSRWGVGPTPDNVATRFVFSPEDNKLMPMPDYGAVTYPDGAAISTVNDVARFLIASLNGGKIDQQQALSANAVSAMLSPQTDTPVPSRDIGYFWELDGDLIHHDGSDPGVMSQMIGDIRHNNGIVLLSNGDDNHEAHEEAMAIIQQLALQLAYTK